MPVIPYSSNTGASGASPLTAKPSETNLLLAAADMHSQGRLVEPAPTMPEGVKTMPNPTKPHKQGRKLKVVK